jgi:hypothetical protein
VVKKFSVEIDRSFEIGGELFKWRQPYWEDYANLLDKDIATAQAAVDAATRTNGGDVPEGETPDTVHAAIEDYIKRVEMFLDPENDSVKRWRALAKRKVDPIATYQFRELHNWLVEVTSGRPPTEPPSPDGPEPTAATSKDASS